MSNTETKPRPRLVKRCGLIVPFTTRVVGDVPALTGTVEVLSAGQWREHSANFAERRESGVPARVIESELYAQHLKSWDFYANDQASEPLPITPANILSLPAAIYEQLDDILRGTVGIVSGNG